MVQDGDMQADRLRTISQVLVERPFLTERWLRRARAERRLTTFVAAGRVLFSLDEIDSHVEATKVEAVRRHPSTPTRGGRKVAAQRREGSS